MILCLDTSALIKRYVCETGSDQVNELLAAQEHAGTTALPK